MTESKPGVGFCDTVLVGLEAVNEEKALRIPTLTVTAMMGITDACILI